MVMRYYRRKKRVYMLILATPLKITGIAVVLLSNNKASVHQRL